MALLGVTVLIASLAGCGASSASQAATTMTYPNAVSTASTTYPDHLVNGDFEYMAAQVMSRPNGTGDPTDFTFIDPAAGQRLAYPSTLGRQTWKSIPGFDKTRFAWTSTQTNNPNEIAHHAGVVELQLDLDGNTYAELAASQSGTAIYQKIGTTPGVAYRVRLKHTSQSASYLDSMRVLIGPENDLQPVSMTRTTSNKAGDKIGETSTTIATHATNTDGITNRNHHGQWATYEGTYIATSDVTVFTFENVTSYNKDTGNLLDDISFEEAYPLDYQGNGSTNGSTPQENK